MRDRPKPHFAPTIARSPLDRLRARDNFILDTTTENVELFNRLLGSVPSDYTWDVLTADAFNAMAETLRKQAPRENAERKLYRLYWRDMLGQIEAFSVMSAYRLSETARSVVRALRREDVICARQ